MISMELPQPTRGFEWVQAPWGPALRCIPLAEVAPHLFTIGNLRLREDPAEWSAVAGALDVGSDRLLLVRQVHGSEVAVRRRGAEDWIIPEADAIVSDDPGAAIAVRVADCAPILVADERRGAVGAVHAGWRGAVQSAVTFAVEAMRVEFGTSPADLIAAIGPCLGACCGEVGEEVVEAFRLAGHDEQSIARWFSPGARGRPLLDLPLANADQLAAAGVPRDRIHVAGLCTRTHAGLMHSYRAVGTRAGRMVGAIRAGLPTGPRTRRR
jgi:YfiH family protein